MKLNLKKGLDAVKKAAAANTPEILIGIGVAELITAVVLTGVGTVKATKKVEAVKKEQKKETLTKKEVVKETYVYYIAPLVLTIGGASCIIGGTKKHRKINAALAAAYGVSEKALSEYKAEAAKVIGPKKLKEIEENAAVAKVVEQPEESMIINTGKGQTLCYDAVSGRYFRSDINSIKSTINEINFRLRTEMYITLNDLYYELGLPIIAIGGELGWNIDDGGLEPVFGSTLTENGTPCLVLDYCIEPKYDYKMRY